MTIAKPIYHAPLPLRVWWRRLIGPIPLRRSDGYYSFRWARPVFWRCRNFTVSESYLSDDDQGKLVAQQFREHGILPVEMPAHVREVLMRELATQEA